MTAAAAGRRRPAPPRRTRLPAPPTPSPAGRGTPGPRKTPARRPPPPRERRARRPRGCRARRRAGPPGPARTPPPAAPRPAPSSSSRTSHSPRSSTSTLPVARAQHSRHVAGLDGLPAGRAAQDVGGDPGVPLAVALPGRRGGDVRDLPGHPALGVRGLARPGAAQHEHPASGRLPEGEHLAVAPRAAAPAGEQRVQDVRRRVAVAEVDRDDLGRGGDRARVAQPLHLPRPGREVQVGGGRLAAHRHGRELEQHGVVRPARRPAAPPRPAGPRCRWRTAAGCRRRP